MSTANSAAGMAPGGPKAMAAGSGGSSGNVAKRLQKELMQLMMSGSKDVTAFPCADNIMLWTATISGPDSSVYQGMTLKLSIAFSDQYPHKAPVVKFTTPLFHPNVDQEGNICLDILKVRATL
jgi:ubiquitin-conjugating enzyme E2 C